MSIESSKSVEKLKAQITAEEAKINGAMGVIRILRQKLRNVSLLEAGCRIKFAGAGTSVVVTRLINTNKGVLYITRDNQFHAGDARIG